jgi:carbon-monoxide dehydrogenase large subunit
VHLELDDDAPGGVRAVVRDGANDQGQAHRTTWALLLHEVLGLPLAAVHLDLGDTGRVPHGEGTGSARSLMLAGASVRRAGELVWDQARQVAAHLLEAAPEDVVVHPDGALGVAGSPRPTLGWAEVVRAAADGGELAALVPGGVLGAEADVTQPGPTFPSGCHAAAVEVDTETGAVALRRVVAVDDCGTVVNPVVVEGQQHGGIVQGVAQALWEEVRHDEAGTPLTTSFADYGIPSAVELCAIEAHTRPSPSPVNGLGAKGIGQAGAIGSTPAVLNAVVDALRPLGVRQVDPPATPERVWRAVREASSGPA